MRSRNALSMWTSSSATHITASALNGLALRARSSVAAATATPSDEAGRGAREDRSRARLRRPPRACARAPRSRERTRRRAPPAPAAGCVAATLTAPSAPRAAPRTRARRTARRRPAGRGRPTRRSQERRRSTRPARHVCVGDDQRRVRDLVQQRVNAGGARAVPRDVPHGRPSSPATAAARLAPVPAGGSSSKNASTAPGSPGAASPCAAASRSTSVRVSSWRSPPRTSRSRSPGERARRWRRKARRRPRRAWRAARTVRARPTGRLRRAARSPAPRSRSQWRARSRNRPRPRAPRRRSRSARFPKRAPPGSRRWRSVVERRAVRDAGAGALLRGDLVQIGLRLQVVPAQKREQRELGEGGPGVRGGQRREDDGEPGHRAHLPSAVRACLATRRGVHRLGRTYGGDLRALTRRAAATAASPAVFW